MTFSCNFFNIKNASNKTHDKKNNIDIEIEMQKRETRISIEAINYRSINFHAIDSRIKPTNNWRDTRPASTLIYVPTSYKEEIIEKLKENENITSINGTFTANGRERNARSLAHYDITTTPKTCR